MNSEMVDRIARAVLYEGYLLYPYRPSALKNQQRWNFGVLYPAAWAGSQTGSDRSYFRMECLARCSEETQVDASLRFLHLVSRDTWQEAIEENASTTKMRIGELISGHKRQSFTFPGDYGERQGVPLQATIEVSATLAGGDAVRLSVMVRNEADCAPGDRNEALLYSLASAHTVLGISNGEFVSIMDPPQDLAAAAAACQNIGVWPVLVGENGARDTMLASPIILYDYPQVAPESQGDLFDGTEIDEILTLRILTLTDAEKEEMRRSDERAARILDRLESSPPEHLLDLHGAIRNSASAVAAVSVQNALKAGDRVRIHARRRADIFDTLLDGKTAVIEAVEVTLEGMIHFAVVLDDDPGRDLGELRQAGHRFFFAAEELEPIA